MKQTYPGRLTVDGGKIHEDRSKRYTAYDLHIQRNGDEWLVELGEKESMEYSGKIFTAGSFIGTVNHLITTFTGVNDLSKLRSVQIEFSCNGEKYESVQIEFSCKGGKFEICSKIETPWKKQLARVDRMSYMSQKVVTNINILVHRWLEGEEKEWLALLDDFNNLRNEELGGDLLDGEGY
tara:strand:- start:3713 stop:4252 length:540 start_codon:yes stop_codon:yes gene_type:complete